MATKVEIAKAEEAKPIGFPKLMIGLQGTLVWMVREERGIEMKHPEAGIQYNWAMNLFTDFTGSVTLTNEAENG